MTPDAAVLDAPTDVHPVACTRTRIALLGFARTFADAPFDDPTVRIVGMNELYKLIPRWDVWFELHDTAYLGKTARCETPDEPARHLNWLRDQSPDKPIYMLRQFPDIPASVAYPLDAMVARFGRYFTSTVGYMLAWAIDEIVSARRVLEVPEPGEWIGLYGIDLASETEYVQQRPNAEYLVGYARGLGITVDIPETAAILHAPSLYGFEPPPAEQGLVNEHFFKLQLGRAQNQHYEYEANMRTLDGVLQLASAMRGDLKKIDASPKTIEFLDLILKTKTDEHGQAMANWNCTGGIIQSFQLCLQALEYRRRGVYVPETDPFYLAPKESTCS